MAAPPRASTRSSASAGRRARAVSPPRLILGRCARDRRSTSTPSCPRGNRATNVPPPTGRNALRHPARRRKRDTQRTTAKCPRKPRTEAYRLPPPPTSVISVTRTTTRRRRTRSEQTLRRRRPRGGSSASPGRSGATTRAIGSTRSKN